MEHLVGSYYERVTATGSVQESAVQPKEVAADDATHI